MKNIIDIAKKAFREGSNIFGEKIVGYDKQGLIKDEFVKYEHYYVILKLKNSEGHRTATRVGFDVKRPRSESAEEFARRNQCEVSPYNIYLNVISGHCVFTIPVTEDMLDLFPMGFNKKRLDQYSIEELEARILDLKKAQFDKVLWETNREIDRLRTKLGLNLKLTTLKCEYLTDEETEVEERIF